jgi:hypothetical protein
VPGGFFEKNAMKIFNKAKTHFMQKDEKGTHIIKFDTIENVQTKINSILDGGSKSSNNSLFEFETVKNPEKSDLINKGS